MDDPSRIPPIASERRRRALTNTSRGRGRGCGRGDDIVLEEAHQILEEDVIDNGSGDDDDTADIDQAEELSGLSSLVHCTYRFVNRIVIAAFVEQWQSETNTFHLTVSEMTMTLDDVGTILGIPITGRSISAATLTDQQAHALVVDALGVDDAKATEELSSARGQSVKLEWLRTKFSGCKDSDTDSEAGVVTNQIQCDKSGTRVPVVYLKLLMDLSDIHTYAWGAAALAYLYR
ncbi:protein MAIN-LIKE 2-like [Camellia sinensis]|uniref:protein MAIN-LIKE 2-like n=1 Tax=Camellia sinensis TaxID=4442 RepID=UPI001036A173|nr:protein MAIN-LIKE 2-like [Camellia sinensis]